MQRTDPFKKSETFLPRGRPLPAAILKAAAARLPVTPANLELLGVKITHFFIGKSYGKAYEIPAGVTIGQHKHNIAHNSALLFGRVHVKNGKGLCWEMTQGIYRVEAEVPHEITAIEPTLWMCLWENAEGHTTPEAFDRSVTTEMKP